MKVLLLCLAFAAVSLAMPIAEEKPDSGAPPPPISKIEEPAVQADAPAENKPDLPELEEVKKSEDKIEPEKQLETKEAEAPKPDESIESKSDKVILEPKSVEAESAVKAEEPKLINPPSEVESEGKSAGIEEKIVEEPKPSEVPATVNEVPKDSSAKSVISEEAIDIVNAVKIDAAVADDGTQSEILKPAPEKKTDLPVVPGADISEFKNAEPAVMQEPVKAEEKKPDEPKPESKAPESTADVAPAPAKPEEPADTSDSLRVVRDTVDDKAKSVEALKEDAKPTEVTKEQEILILPEEKKEQQTNIETELTKAEKDAPAPEPTKTEKSVPKEVDSARLPVNTEAIAATAEPKSKPDEKPLNDSPAVANHSEESDESSEKKGDTTSENSSEENASKS